ncbi:cytochrome P450 [Ustulina deusta]|nr:cytochrome P450 [Ustulina deusta]
MTMATLLRTALTAAPTALGAAVAITLIITSLNLIHRLFSNASLPNNLPWVGVGKYDSRLGRAKGNLTGFFHLNKLLDEGYVKYSKNDQTYVLPYFINGPQVVLPPSQIPWLMAQADDVLSQEHVNRQFLQAEYSFFHANMVEGPVHPEIVQHQLTKKISGFTAALVDEVRACLDDYWGTDTDEWREVRVYDTLLLLIARMVTRVLMGLPLCRDEAFVAICGNFIRKVALAAAAISLFPSFLKPIVGPIFTLFDYILYRRCSNFLMPVIRERLDRLRERGTVTGTGTGKIRLESATAHNDYVQWAVDHALAKPVANPAEFEPRVIAARFSVLAFAAIQSSVITLTNVVFDLAASGSCAGSLAAMREEVLRETMTATHDNNNKAGGEGSERGWTKTALARMTHVDSALRESLRINGFVERGIMKMVVAPAGVTLPDGSHVPRGTKVGVSGYSIHHDERNYVDAKRYDAFRFARPRDGDGDAAGKKKEKEKEKKKRPQGLVNTSETFLSFSHGSHACPGRFFATNQLKIALGHIALLYDIEPVAERPANKWLFGHIAPPLTETLRVRRRKM